VIGKHSQELAECSNRQLWRAFWGVASPKSLGLRAQVHTRAKSPANLFAGAAAHGIRGKMSTAGATTSTTAQAASRPSSFKIGHGIVNSTGSASLPQILARVLLYALPAVLFLRKFGIFDHDIWWHLATGRWILQNHALPHTDPFSVYGMDKPWFVYSWVFDLVMQGLNLKFGFVGIIFFEIAARVAIMVALFCLLQFLQTRFWIAVALAALAFYAMSVVLAPRPAILTILFSILELHLLLAAQRSGQAGKLWLLPPMLLLWANWHIQFVYGLLILGVFALDSAGQSVWHVELGSKNLGFRKLSAIFVASLLATLVNPYGPKVYETVYQYMHQPKVFSLVIELRAMDFRQAPHFVALFLMLAAAMAVGWRRQRRLLWPALLFLAALLAFRSVKEIWFLSVVSTCALSDGWMEGLASKPSKLALRERLLVAVAVVALIATAYRHYDVSNDWVEIQVSGKFPEAAVRYIEKNHLAGPMYNDFNDGGFVIWRLPWLRVAMDGRTNVHGDKRVGHSADVWNGNPVWESDPELLRANVVLAPRNAALTSLLRLDPRFRVVFQDAQAVVFQPR